ncbi:MULTISPECIES: bifunctional UDP-N-acetylmuramoyl-tripeptide:D-alanyl-D-alanine ligase/alanine racemase [unclassified Dysgonomonas]|jgi:alanine racemase|uniref:bifunctional UDP-N-acetylmuramoyl-tripeptide:D-alanyl-D-alanine ligase/alanine racemase n=1 Tax=unclassified Dysgonomonas TaxID=2630389 RepID=UPI0025B83C52|nr:MULTISPECIES: bifunctional UDP-N-acetylmuramoyl-tripeptide:D-alanyl-D-alanine ligase/alanine racemase [unclassified Dysgonomonas]MDR2003551.1 bifunctional UDP-N-acetylmuramoyl-tripeptide:D-alanyl-D-alanine ligase/alanine racemase [Prevotella sp.]HMM04403.1 bifunctional UDP-N-acetylmuramoyl-tripeptide:D-alanyl-D-alanine ligase/alanine racemase [Dysgonomonas sp.]
MKYSIHKIAKILDAIASDLNDADISILLTDSRQVFYPAETLFFALSTKNNDGHKYINELYELGVRNFVVSQILPDWENYQDANFLVVTNTLTALQRIAAYHRNQFDIPVIGITGSNGKTVVKEWLYQILHQDFNITHSPRSYNSQIGVPLSVWQMNDHTQLGIFEAGISQPEEMSKLEAIIRPTIGILTNIGQAHQEGFKSMKQKCLEKLELFINCDVIICEEENELIDECMEIACLSHKRLTWSRRGSSKSPLYVMKIEKQEKSTTIHYSVLGMASKLTIPFSDDASIEDAIHVLATAFYLHMSLPDINGRMATLEPVAMRLDVRQGKNNSTLINDSYNSDINSLNIALDFLVQRATANEQKKVLIISDIPQSGLILRELYYLAANLVLNKKIDLLIGIGQEISDHKEMFKDTESLFFNTTEDFIHSNIWHDFHDMFILLKGARSFSFESINKLLEVKTHETVLNIDLDAIVHNFKFYRSKLNPKTKMICMVKADGYGTGSSEVAKTLQYHKCDYLAVAVAEEGVILRKQGIKVPIIVLNSEVGGFEELATYSLEPEVYNFRILDAFIKEAKLQGITNYPIHIKIDTGMHRLGFTEEDIPELMDRVKGQTGVRIQSVFSHLAASESWNFDDFTLQQIKTFKKIAGEIEESCHYPVMKHILNSAGIERFPEEQLDMVRLGISLYGVSASGLNGLRNVCTLKTTILQIKHIKAGETVGYGRKGHFDHDATIATIRIGYADGISRQFGNGVGVVLVNGHQVSIVGNICMDLTMIDVTGIEVKEGDIVTIFGENLPVTDLAKKINTIPYEIFTSISNRVKHIYYKE